MAEARLEQILDAAYSSFVRHGLKRTTMDDIATAAGMSRAGVYQYIRNKDDAFRRLSERLFAQALEQARTAAAGDAPVVDRLHAVLSVKLELTLRLQSDGPHVAELLDASARLSGDVVDSFNEELQNLAASTVSQAVQDGEVVTHDLNPQDVAQLGLALVRGVVLGTGQPEQLRRQLRLGLELLLDGLH